MLAGFSRSVVIRMKVPFNKSNVITLDVKFACQFGLIDVTLHLRPPFGSPLQSFHYAFRHDYDW